MNEWNVLGTIGMIRYLLESRRTVVESFSRALGLGLDLGLGSQVPSPQIALLATV